MSCVLFNYMEPNGFTPTQFVNFRPKCILGHHDHDENDIFRFLPLDEVYLLERYLASYFSWHRIRVERRADGRAEMLLEAAK